jgi:hypothetical protein
MKARRKTQPSRLQWGAAFALIAGMLGLAAAAVVTSVHRQAPTLPGQDYRSAAAQSEAPSIVPSPRTSVHAPHPSVNTIPKRPITPIPRVQPAIADAGAVSTVTSAKIDIVNDLNADVAAEEMLLDRTARISDAASASTVVGRHAKLASAWAPSVLSLREATLDAAITHSAADQRTPSIVDAHFQVVAWQGVQVTGNTATAVLTGYFALDEPDNPDFHGWFNQPTEQWQLALQETAGHWRLLSKSGVALGDAISATTSSAG